MSDTKTLTAEDIDETWEICIESDPCPTLWDVFTQAKRVPELVAELDRYRKVAEAALAYLKAEFRPVLPEHKKIGDDRDKAVEVVHRGMELRAALAAIGMKVE